MLKLLKEPAHIYWVLVEAYLVAIRVRLMSMTSCKWSSWAMYESVALSMLWIMTSFVFCRGPFLTMTPLWDALPLLYSGLIKLKFIKLPCMQAVPLVEGSTSGLVSCAHPCKVLSGHYHVLLLHCVLHVRLILLLRHVRHLLMHSSSISLRVCMRVWSKTLTRWIAEYGVSTHPILLLVESISAMNN
jgi:hypothetical protein